MTVAHQRRRLFTVVGGGETTVQEVAESILHVHQTHGDTIQKFHEVWYNQAFTWPMTSYAGIAIMKAPNDLWQYQELIAAKKPKTIIETGTYTGASALFFAHLMDAFRIDGHIYTMDVTNQRKIPITHPRITFMEEDSTDPAVVKRLLPKIEYPILISLDADHSEAHVYDELCLYAPLVPVGDWLIVEDTNISWPSDRGAGGGLAKYQLEHPMELRPDILCQRHLMTCHPGGWLQRVHPYQKPKLAAVKNAR